MTLNTREIADLLRDLLTRDMGAVQSRVLANRDWLEPAGSLGGTQVRRLHSHSPDILIQSRSSPGMPQIPMSSFQSREPLPDVDPGTLIIPPVPCSCCIATRPWPTN